MRKYIIIGLLFVAGLIGLFTLSNYWLLASLLLISVSLILLVKFTVGREAQPTVTEYTDRLT